MSQASLVGLGDHVMGTATSCVRACLKRIRRKLAWWAITQRALKNHNIVKIEGWAIARGNMVVHVAVVSD